MCFPQRFEFNTRRGVNGLDVFITKWELVNWRTICCQTMGNSKVRDKWFGL